MPGWKARLTALHVILPAVSVSVIDFPHQLTRQGTGVFETFFCAGLIYIKNPSIEGRLVRSEIKPYAGCLGGKAATYFVNLLAMNDRAVIDELITEPMLKMYAGEDSWVNQKNLPVFSLEANNLGTDSSQMR